MRKLLTPVFVAFFLVGCASASLVREAETPEQKYWAALHIFDTYDEAALRIAQDHATPVAVQQNLKKIRGTAKAALVLADEAYTIMQGARMELDLVPDETNLDKLTAAIAIFNGRSSVAFQKVDAFKASVDSWQGVN